MGGSLSFSLLLLQFAFGRLSLAWWFYNSALQTLSCSCVIVILFLLMKCVLRDFRERKSPILELELEAGIVIPSATAEQEVAAQYSTGTPACIWPCSSTALDSGCLARVSHREPKASCSKVQSWCHNVIRKKKEQEGKAGGRKAPITWLQISLEKGALR